MAEISHHEALIHLMVTMSAADRSMTDKELAKIGNIVKLLPIFADFNMDRLTEVAAQCSEILQDENGLDTIIENVRSILPHNLHETAYALALEVAAADLVVHQEELRLLEIVRDGLEIDRLIAAGIERGARARHQIL